MEFKDRSNKLVMLVLIISVISLLFVGCGKEKATTNMTEGIKQVEKEVKVPVEVLEAKTGELVEYITAAAQAEPIKSIQVTPQLQGEVGKVYVSIGDKVNKGDKLLTLDKENILIQVEQAKAGLQAAQANLEKLLKGTREERLAQLRAQLEQAKSNYEQTKKSYERQKKLYEQEIISEQQLETIKVQYVTAKSSYESAKQELTLAKNPSTKEEIKALEAQVEQAESNLKSAKLQLDHTEITAPISGIIVKVNVEAGEIAGMQPVVAIVDIDKIKTIAYISESNVNKVNVGDEVKVNFNALNKEFVGKVKSISPVADKVKRSFPVEVVIDNKSNIIKAGMYGEIKFKANISSGQVVIPQAAILSENGLEYVYIIKDNIAIRKEVKIGLATAKEAIVLEGIQAGDQVIVKGQEDIKADTKVEVVNRGDK
ncbi:hypothetical protein U472_07575 [Orenia metallireducens]|uniref:RND family efflux transporter, MFP subunit n=1 Tax=Orenia metallireducens TaxID=1413210 RepID=A0A1C0AAM3_9FIRM|nr:efflux RND transporter periplasmic adaptor subunit [Orenia metallireducens]OCL27313.1 hypothetical protein U472_07575 [Orenia metallireducens]